MTGRLRGYWSALCAFLARLGLDFLDRGAAPNRAAIKVGDQFTAIGTGLAALLATLEGPARH